MKLMQNGVFIDEIWVKIAVGTLSYCWNSILAVGSQIGSNLAVGSLYNRWNRIWTVGSTRAWFGPSNHARERSDISPKNRRYIAEKSAINWHHGDFPLKSLIYRVSPIYCWFFGDFFAKYPSSNFFFHEMSCRPLSIHDISAIYRRYFATFSFLLASNPEYDQWVILDQFLLS